MNSSCVVLQKGKTAQMRGWNSRIGKRKAKSSWIKAMTQVVVAVVVASVSCQRDHGSGFLENNWGCGFRSGWSCELLPGWGSLAH